MLTAAELQLLEPLLRIMRSFLILGGIVAITQILKGGFTFMVASGRNDTHDEGLGLMGGGIITSVVAATLFAVVSVVLERIA